MKALLENIDLFAHKVNFNFRNKNLYHSFFGIGLSFVVYGVMIFCFYYFSRDFFNRTNPNIIYKETKLKENVKIKFNDIMEPLIEAKIFVHDQVNMTEIKEIRDNSDFFNGFFGKLHLFHTKENHFYKFISFDLSTQIIPIPPPEKNLDFCDQNNLCNKFEIRGFMNANSSFYSSGYLNKSFMDLINIKEEMKKIAYEDIGFTLSAEDEISLIFEPGVLVQELLKTNKVNNTNFFLLANFTNYIIDANNELFFDRYYTREIFNVKFDREKKEISTEALKTNYGQIILNDDRGFIFTDKKPSYCIKKNSEYKEKDKSQISILIYKIKLDMLAKEYDRIYKKIQNIFADLGGIFSSITLIGNFLIVQFNKKKFDYDLINQVFKIAIDEEEHEKRKITKAQKVEVLEAQKNSFIVEMDSSRNFIKNSFYKGNNVNEAIKPIQEKKEIFNQEVTTPSLSLRQNPLRGLKESNSFSKDLSVSVNNIALNESKSINKINSEINMKENEDKKLYDDEESKMNELFAELEKGKLFKKPLKYSKADFLRTFLCCLKYKGDDLIIKEKLFDAAQIQIYQKMDVINYIKLFEKNDKLISILFNEHQALSISFMRNKNICEFKNKENDRNSLLKLIDYFRKNLKESKMSLIDERIMKELYPSLIKII